LKTAKFDQTYLQEI